MRKLLILSVVANLAFLSAGLAYVHHRGGISWLRRRASGHVPTWADERESVFDHLAISSNDTVFVGDSIVAAGEWSELMQDPRC